MIYFNMAHTNKFQIGWQLARVNARSLKDVSEKIAFVKAFLESNNSEENYFRVKNWSTMTAMAYRDASIKTLFKEFSQHLETITYDKADEPNDFSQYSYKDLIRVHKDLSKRKYGFQYSKVPSSHTSFMNELTSFIETSF